MQGTTQTNGRETLKQRKERLERERAQLRAQASAAREAAKPAPAQPAAAAWSFEDEEDVGGDVLSPVACEFMLNLLENVAPNAINAANRALLDVLRTKVRRAVVRGRGAVFLEAQEPKDTLVAGDPEAKDLPA